jgi:hypothetical protein
MGKRSNLKVEDRPKDFWGTVDPDAIPPKFAEMIRGKTYAEPCYGNGDLEDLLMEVATCKWRSDVRETVGSSKVMDALDITKEDLKGIDVIITNPPFKWEWLQPLLNHLPTLKPTWFLLPADFMHNKRSSPYMERCAHVIAIRRLYWWLDTGNLNQNGVKGKDNYCWYRFHESEWGYGTRFWGRQ